MDKQTKQQQYIATHRKIFQEACLLFQQKSYENVTIRDICQHCGLSIGAFYHHYQSKEALLNEGYHVFDHVLEESWKEKQFKDAKEEILFLLTMELESMEHQGVTYSIQYFKNQLTTEEKYILNEDRFFYKTLYEACERYKKKDAIKLTKQLLQCTRGTIYDWCLHNGDYALVEQGLTIVHIVLQYYED